LKRYQKFWLRAVVLLIVAAGSALAIWQLRRTDEAVNLPFARARKGDFLVLVRCRGELVADRFVQVNAPVDVPDLQIVWLAPSGSEVQAGETVVRFDPSRTQQDIIEKQAALQQAQASLDQAQAHARITTDQDALDLDNARFQAEKARLEASKKSVVSAIQGEESAIDLAMAEERLKVRQAAVAVHRRAEEQTIASLQRWVRVAQDQVDVAKSRLSKMEVKSPLNGVINYLPNFSQGWVNAQPFKIGDHAWPGAALAEIPDLKTLQMEAKVDETDRGRIRVGDEVMVHVDAFPERDLHAKLVSITPLTERSFNEWPPTSSFRAYAQLENPDPRMRPGMNAGADLIQTRIRNAVSVPVKAVFTRNGKPAVYVRTGNQYLPHEVRVKARNPDEVAIDGIPAGTEVALSEPQQEKP
jgi:HlyD family secretion protein